MLAIVCPGQGSQTPGFLAPWLELPGFHNRLEWLSVCAGTDLVAHGTESDAATIRDTAVAQPLLVGAGLLSLLALFDRPSQGFRQVSFGAGHSVGEITAAAAAGVVTAEQAIAFVGARGREMAKAAATAETGMSAVLGGSPAEVERTLADLGLTAANANGAGQVVAAGTTEQLAALAAAPPAKARVIPLPVAGAFHTHHMSPAVEQLGRHSSAISTHDARIPLISNADGAVVNQGRDVLGRIVRQVSNPVRWDLVMDTLVDLGITGLIEVPPAGTLVGLAKRAMPGVELLALKTPEDLVAAHRMIAEHGLPSATADAENDSLVISPRRGTVRVTRPQVGSTVARGEQLASVISLHARHGIAAPESAQVLEWLVADGSEVAPGQPLARLDPAV